MPWISLASLISISRRRRIDPRRLEVYIEEEVINSRPRNPEKAFEIGLAPEDDKSQYDEEEDEY